VQALSSSVTVGIRPPWKRSGRFDGWLASRRWQSSLRRRLRRHVAPAAGAGTGPTPELPAPTTSITPTVHIAPARPWSAGEAPRPAAGIAVNAFARGLHHPRWLHVLPDGDVLVAETAARRHRTTATA
jgi:glucose/arabinose dehydrogenase